MSSTIETPAVKSGQPEVGRHWYECQGDGCRQRLTGPGFCWTCVADAKHKLAAWNGQTDR